MKTALITGASSGIGREFARLCARDYEQIVLVARQQSALEELAQELQRDYSVKAVVLVKDLARDNAAVELVDALIAQQLTIDALINNAGFGNSGAFSQTPLAAEKDLLTLNMTTLTLLTKLLLPSMLARGYGKILNVASTAAFQPGPFMATYYASKAYVLSFSLALAEELRSTGVTITTLCPGPTATGFANRAGIATTRLFQGYLPLMTAHTVAKIGYKAMQRGKRIVITGWKNKLLVKLSLFTPDWINLRLIRMFNSKPNN